MAAAASWLAHRYAGGSGACGQGSGRAGQFGQVAAAADGEGADRRDLALVDVRNRRPGLAAERASPWAVNDDPGAAVSRPLGPTVKLSICEVPTWEPISP